MKQAVFPPQAIPVSFEEHELPALWEVAPMHKKRKWYRSILYGVVVGLATPFAIGGGMEVAKELENIRVTSKSPQKCDADLLEEEEEIVASNIPKYLRITINGNPEFAAADWNNSTLSCIYGTRTASVSFIKGEGAPTFSRFTLGNTDVHVSQPINFLYLPRVLSNASKVLDHLQTQGKNVSSLTSPDGARFEFFLRKNSGQEEKYVATLTGVYRYLPSASSTTYEQLLLEEATNTTISEKINNGETQWYYTKHGKSVFDIFNAHTLLHRWEFPSPKETTLTEFHPGSVSPHSVTYWKEQSLPNGTTQKNIVLERYYLPNGHEYKRHNREFMLNEHYDKNGETVLTESYRNQEEMIDGIKYVTRKSIAHLFYHAGQQFSLYPDQKQQKPSLTPKQYLQKLATALNSHQKMHMFVAGKPFWEYVFDSPDPKHHPLLKGTEQNHGQYAQTGEETVQRVEYGKMLGDCDDLAELICEVARMQGKNVHCIADKDHVFAAWIEKCDNGKYNGISADFDGLRMNGRPYAITEDNGQGIFETPQEAFEAVLIAYPNALQYHPLPRVTTYVFPANTERTVHVRALVSPRSIPVQIARK